MSKKDYRKQIEEHRQSIEINEGTTRLSRVERRRRRKKKKSKETPLLTALTVILIGIPLAILIYVWAFWDPGKEAAVEEDDNMIEVQRNDSVSEQDKDQEMKEDEKQVSNESEKGSESDDRKKSIKNGDTSTAHEASSEQQEHKDSERSQDKVKIHTVAANENLFRIAKRYYSDPISGVEKIKKANHLTSDIISPGQSLVIPD